jgi:hypothetical protein
MKKLIAYGMVTVGFMGAALVSVLEVATLVWLHYAVWLGIGIGGVVLIRSHMKELWTEPDALAGNMKTLIDCMTRVVDTCGNYQGASLTPQVCLSMHSTIDNTFMDDLRHFADARESITRLHGLQNYAEIMSSFATGERYLNRVWSSSADGYIDEVALFMPQVQAQFTECLTKLKKLG